MHDPTGKLSTGRRRRLLRNTQFRWLFAGNTSLFFGFAASALMRSLLAWQLTGEEMALAYINLATAVCMFSTSIFSGTIIDRFEKRRIILIAQVIILVSEAVVLALLASGHLTFGLLMAGAVVLSFTYPFIMPARTAMLVETVGRESLGKATAMISAGVNVARMTSPAVVGIVADLAGNTYAYLILIAIHITSLCCSLSLRRSWPGTASGEAFLNDIKAGFVYIFNHRPLATCLLFGLMPILIVIPLQNLLVIFADHLWDRGGSGLGILMSAMGIGGLLGSLLMTLLKEGSLVKPMAIGTLALGLCLLLFGNSPSFWLAVVVMVGIYGCSVLAQTLVNTAVQLMTEDRVRGRISTMMLMSYGLAPLGTIPLAFATKHIGASWALTVASLLLLAAVLLMWFLVPSFRRIDEAARITPPPSPPSAPPPPPTPV